MNRQQAREVIDSLGIRVISSDGHGIVIERWDMSTRRVYTGGGIAGHSGEIWMDVPGLPHATFGPYRTKRSLTAALRAWRKPLRDVLGRSYSSGI